MVAVGNGPGNIAAKGRHSNIDLDGLVRWVHYEVGNPSDVIPTFPTDLGQVVGLNLKVTLLDALSHFQVGDPTFEFTPTVVLEGAPLEQGPHWQLVG